MYIQTSLTWSSLRCVNKFWIIIIIFCFMIGIGPWVIITKIILNHPISLVHGVIIWRIILRRLRSIHRHSSWIHRNVIIKMRTISWIILHLHLISIRMTRRKSIHIHIIHVIHGIWIVIIISIIILELRIIWHAFII